MNQRQQSFGWIWTTCVLMTLCVPCRAPGQQSGSSGHNTIQSASTQFLILKTGSVYSGQLEFGGGKYVIRRSNGSSVRFVQGEVDFVTDSLEEAYQRLYSRIEPGDVIGHQRLANWCLKNRQIESAKRQLMVLENLTRESRITSLLKRQINDLTHPKSEQTPVQMASHESTGETGIRRLPSTETRMATRLELKNTVESFSRESIRDFNRNVHLRMVNGCAASRCHGDPENPLRLWRVDNRGGISSTGVQRNLHAISRYLDRQNPVGSKLLQYVSQAHGDMDEPAYEPTSHHFHAIKAWILGTGRTDIPGTAEQEDNVSQTAFVKPPAETGGEMPGVPADGSIPAPIDLSREEKRFQPRDEFDPEIFNRKYGTREDRVSDSQAHRPTATETLQPTTAPLTPANTGAGGKVKRSRPLPPIDDGLRK